MLTHSSYPERGPLARVLTLGEHGWHPHISLAHPRPTWEGKEGG